jgi:RNA polymerase sigma factor for flagellar operon FliA
VPAVVIDAELSSSCAVDELIEAHVPLVGHLVREVMAKVPAHVHRDDLASAGMMALVLAARGFDPTRGVPFARFAAVRIRGSLTDELRAMDWATRGVRSKSREIDTVEAMVSERLGRTASRDEVAQAMGLSTAQINSVEADVHRAGVVSLQGLGPDDAEELLPAIGHGPESLLLKREELGLLHDAIAELPTRLRTVIEAYFFGDRKMADIAAIMGITESRVSQLRTEALGYLRDALHSNAEGQPTSIKPVKLTESAADRRRAGARETYRTAVHSRSAVAQRLSRTSALGEVLPVQLASAI